MKLRHLLCVVPFMFGASLTHADPAAVIDDFGCVGFVPDGGDGSLGTLVTEESHAVVTGSGVSIVTCQFDHDIPIDQAYGAKGFICGTFDGLTTDTMMLATPGGKAVLVCKINGADI